MTVSRYGHLWSAPVVVDVCLRTEWEPPTLRAPLWDSTRFGASSMAFCLSYVARTRLLVATVLDFATRSLVRLRTSRWLLFVVHIGKVPGSATRERRIVDAPRCPQSGS